VKPNIPTRVLREHPDLDQLKRQAKELLEGFRAGDDAASAEINAHYRNAERATFALHDAQLVLARSYGFDSWPKLKAYVDGVTARALAEAVRGGDAERVRRMLKARPELVNFEMAENDEHRAIHYAVFARSAEMVRILMESGADARQGIYPHRRATTAYTIAVERGYAEIVEIIEAAEARRRGMAPPTVDELVEAIFDDEEERALAMLEGDALLAGARRADGCTPLHAAAARGNERLTEWLLVHGADVSARGPRGMTPLDATTRAAGKSAALLRAHGAELTARGAVALGDAAWLRARHGEGALEPEGLLTAAVECDRPEILKMLLDFGFDPNERTRLEDLEQVVWSAGSPLWHCADSGKYEMAELLLARGADPNVHVYAGGPSVHRAWDRKDRRMIELLARHGGVLPPVSIGLFRERELAKEMLADEAAGRHLPAGILEGRNVSEDLLRGAADSGDPEIVRMALPGVDWPRDSDRWFWILMQAVWAGSAECLGLVLTRCDPNLRHPRFGRTILHDVAGLGLNNTAERSAELAGLLLDAGARMNERDDILRSTPLGWACRWGRIEMARLLLERGADPVEADAEPWATPRAWAEKRKHNAVLALLREYER
jgi:ankyrin repeat protein